MSIALDSAVIAGCAAFTAALMLVIRGRFASGGGHFRDSDRASSVFTFVGAGFAILLGFVVLLSFDGYRGAKSKAEDEATAVFEQYEVATLFQPIAKRNRLWGELVCYARAVAEDEWPAMRNGRRSPLVDTWLERLEAEVPGAQIATMGESTAYRQWFDQSAVRDVARRQRLLEANGGLPAILWIMLIIAAVSVVGFVLLYADPRERALGQAVFSGAVTAVVVSSLLAVAMLASPFQGGNGSIKPTAMRYTLTLINEEASLLHDPLLTPCDARGHPA